MPTQKSGESQLIEVGKKAPAFTLKDQAGQSHRLKDYVGRWVVLYFYPKDDTPGCTTQACGFRDAHPEFEGLNAVILGVSPDDEKKHAKFVAKHDLPFTLLADIEQKICTKYGVWQEKAMYGKKYMGVVRTTYLIDPAGKVVDRFDKVKVKDHASAVAEAISEHA